MGPLEGEASLLNPSPHRLIGVKRRPARRFPAEPLALADVEALRAACWRRAPTGIRNRALLAVLFRSGLRNLRENRPSELVEDSDTRCRFAAMSVILRCACASLSRLGQAVAPT